MNGGIVFDNVFVSFGDKAVLSAFSHSFSPATSTAVTGPSGSGKTTLLRLAAGLLKPQSGTVTVERGERIGYLFQEDRLLPRSTALENVMFTGATEQKARAALNAVLLGDEAQSFPRQLSGGMRRRLAIARLLAFDCTVMLLDEPVRGLDTQTKDVILGVLSRALTGKTALVVTHDTEEIRLLAQDTVIIGSD